jgi:clathrin heavy chain
LCGCVGAQINPEFLATYFGTLSVDDTLDILRDMLRVNMRNNLQTVVQISAKYSEQITPTELIKLYEQFKCYDGMFFYLGQIVNTSEDKEVHFKYIDAATRTRNYKEVERICRDSNHYDPAQVREYLKVTSAQLHAVLFEVFLISDRLFVFSLARRRPSFRISCR